MTVGGRSSPRAVRRPSVGRPLDLGLAMAQQGRIAEAEAQFAGAVRIRPDFREAQGNLARARQLLGK
jgi:cytochrome c-type biogenesis protein CcmH/NrfG